MHGYSCSSHAAISSQAVARFPPWKAAGRPSTGLRWRCDPLPSSDMLTCSVQPSPVWRCVRLPAWEALGPPPTAPSRRSRCAMRRGGPGTPPRGGVCGADWTCSLWDSCKGACRTPSSTRESPFFRPSSPLPKSRADSVAGVCRAACRTASLIWTFPRHFRHTCEVAPFLGA